MAEESGVGVRRRGREEIARLAALYRKSGMVRSEFCRSHGMALSTLARHLKKQSGEQRLSENSMAGESRLIAVELAAMLLQQQGNSVAPLRCCCPTAGKWRLVAASMLRLWWNW